MSIYNPGRPHKYNPASGQGKKPPQLPGEYRIRDASGSIVYIGETCNLARRTREHIRTGKLQTSAKSASTIEYQIADSHSTSHMRRIHEREKIAKHQPSLNRSAGGEGRVAN